jgi:hypothetical protein
VARPRFDRLLHRDRAHPEQLRREMEHNRPGDCCDDRHPPGDLPRYEPVPSRQDRRERHHRCVCRQSPPGPDRAAPISHQSTAFPRVPSPRMHRKTPEPQYRHGASHNVFGCTHYAIMPHARQPAFTQVICSGSRGLPRSEDDLTPSMMTPARNMYRRAIPASGRGGSSLRMRGLRAREIFPANPCHLLPQIPTNVIEIEQRSDDEALPIRFETRTVTARSHQGAVDHARKF